MFELKLKIKRDNITAAAEIIRCLLLNLGVAPDAIVEEKNKQEQIVSVYDDSENRIRQLNAAIRHCRLDGVKTSLVVLKDEHWQEKWKKYFKPFKITRAILLVPAHLKNTSSVKKKLSSGIQPVYIDTTFAFGSGMHATTQMMAGFLHACKGHYATVLDIGTGSGVLAIIAGLYGAGRIFAIDNDKEAIKTARHNFELNDIRPEFLKTIPFERYAGKKQFDFVAANLLTEDLIRMQKELYSSVKQSGYLAVSGIFKDNYSLFKKRFKMQGLKPMIVMQRKEWYALLFQKT